MTDCGVDAVYGLSNDTTFDIAHVLQTVAEVVHATLTEHDIVVQVLTQPFPELERFLLEQRRFGAQVVGTHDRRVAARIAAADPVFLEHGNVAHAVLFRQVVRRCRAMAAAADNDDIVSAPGLRAAPRTSPVSVVTCGMSRQAECRVVLNSASCMVPSLGC